MNAQHAQILKRRITAAMAELNHLLHFANEIASDEFVMEQKDLSELIPETVAAFYGCSVSDMRRRGRKRRESEPRQVTAFLLRTMTRLSLDEIGYILRRDHTTIIYSMEAVESHLKRNPAFRRNIESIRRQLVDLGAALKKPENEEVEA